MKSYAMKNWVMMSVALIACVGLFVLPHPYKKAISQNPLIFGGWVLSSIPCTCSGGFLLTISPPVGGQFVYELGTPQFANYMLPAEGVWTLGLYTPGGVCTEFSGKGCVPISIPQGTISPIVGTSF